MQSNPRLSIEVLKILKLHDGRPLLDLKPHEPGWTELEGAIHLAAINPNDPECVTLAHEAVSAYVGDYSRGIDMLLRNIAAIIDLMAYSIEELLGQSPTKH